MEKAKLKINKILKNKQSKLIIYLSIKKIY